ncbi:MAG: serine hydrolase [Lachnospiraceae bacterium]|nr:serine hydrolase [Lachnospiraceae bacterium]
MYCTHCGTELDDDAKFCINCGMPVDEVPQDDISGDFYPNTSENQNVENNVLYPQSNGSNFNVSSNDYVHPQSNNIAYGANNTWTNPQNDTSKKILNNVPVSSKSNMPIIIIIAVAVFAVIVSILLVVFLGNKKKSIPPTSSFNINDYKISFQQADYSKFPKIKLYYSIVNNSTGKSITDDDLAKLKFNLTENIGDKNKKFANKSLKTAKIDDNSEASICLVADTSDSMGESGLSSAEQGITDFLDSVQFNKGDKVALLSFNESVYLEQNFSSNKEDISTSTNMLRLGGDTALYDALYSGINRVVAQGGAKCVIAFTDGQDNRSSYTPEEIIDIAKKYDVPVYLIGVGEDVDNTQLQSISEETGGKYTSIDSISSLTDQYNSIFNGQKQMVCLQYQSFDISDKSSERDISLDIKSGSDTTNVENSFTPIVLEQISTTGVSIDQNGSKELSSYVKSAKVGGNLNAAVNDVLGSNIALTSKAQKPQSASALIDIPILYTIDDQMRSGSIDMNTMITFHYTVDGRGILKKEQDGQQFTLNELVLDMLSYSDNNVINSLMDYLGKDVINSTCKNAGYKSVKINRHIIGTSSKVDNYVSPVDLAGMLGELYSSSSDVGRGFIQSNFLIVDKLTRVGIGKNIPSEYGFLNQNGIRTKLYNEIAIIEDNSKTYIAVFMGQGVDEEKLEKAAVSVGEYVSNQY